MAQTHSQDDVVVICLPISTFFKRFAVTIAPAIAIFGCYHTYAGATKYDGVHVSERYRACRKRAVKMGVALLPKQRPWTICFTYKGHDSVSRIHFDHFSSGRDGTTPGSQSKKIDISNFFDIHRIYRTCFFLLQPVHWVNESFEVSNIKIVYLYMISIFLFLFSVSNIRIELDYRSILIVNAHSHRGYLLIVNTLRRIELFQNSIDYYVFVVSNTYTYRIRLSVDTQHY